MGRKTKQNSIVSPELLAQVNPENIQLMNDFVDYLKSLQRSQGTIDQYINDLKIAFVWCLEHNSNKFFVNWTKRNIVAYQNWLLNENENSPARVRRLKAALSSLSNFIENVLDDEYPNFRNIINKIESPVNQPVREKTVLTDEQIDGLLQFLTDKKFYDRACVLALAVYSGRRKAELVRFKVSDFDDSHLVCDGALYKSAPIKTKGRGVNGKMLECFTLAKQFKPYFDNWMAYREQNGIDSEWLFPNVNKPEEHIQTTTLSAWAAGFSKYLGEVFYFHACRHYCVSRFKRAGIPDTVIQQYIGWSDISMVPVYTDLDADEQLGMYFNQDGITAPKQTGFDNL